MGLDCRKKFGDGWNFTGSTSMCTAPYLKTAFAKSPEIVGGGLAIGLSLTQLTL